ncbi:unnamed protein product [Brugia pahangi]|uniref:DUF5641 domain-containing protein n=1 Tax=Brugia pahangi TaxID=6280 RepID=A0A0N4T841_BRUPA|nr:unnamed protein product [Brugia pahangi]
MWKLLRIKDIKIDKDGKVRNVQVETPTGKLLDRPINVLYPLEEQYKTTILIKGGPNNYHRTITAPSSETCRDLHDQKQINGSKQPPLPHEPHALPTFSGRECRERRKI